MPAYNGIRGYWNEVRVNSNYKSKNAVPQGTELEAGMQTKMEKSRYGFWKPGFLFATLFFAALLFAGCSVEQTNRTKISDLDYTIAAEADIPEELQNDIEEKKAAGKERFPRGPSKNRNLCSRLSQRRFFRHTRCHHELQWRRFKKP